MRARGVVCIRLALHENTGFSPAELVYGRGLRSPLRLLREAWEGYGGIPPSLHTCWIFERLRRELVESNMKAAQVLSKTYYDKSARQRTFSVGDEVMLMRPSKKHKLEVHWQGPSKVLSKLPGTNYEVKLRRKQNSFP